MFLRGERMISKSGLFGKEGKQLGKLDLLSGRSFCTSDVPNASGAHQQILPAVQFPLRAFPLASLEGSEGSARPPEARSPPLPERPPGNQAPDWMEQDGPR